MYCLINTTFLIVDVLACMSPLNSLHKLKLCTLIFALFIVAQRFKNFPMLSVTFAHIEVIFAPTYLTEFQPNPSASGEVMTL